MKQQQVISTIIAFILLLVFVACHSTEPSSQTVLISTSVSIASSISDTAFNSEETQSSSVILPFEAPENWQEPLPKGMMRGWYGSTSVGAGYVNRYLFQADGTFYFAQNANLAGERLRYMDGDWHYKDGMIVLTVKRKIVIEGGEYVEGDAAKPLLSDIIGGTRVQIELIPENYEILQLPLRIVETDIEYPAGDDIKGSIMLGEEQYWAKGGIDYNEMLAYWDNPEYP